MSLTDGYQAGMTDNVVVSYLLEKLDLQANIGIYLHAPILAWFTDSNRLPSYEQGDER